MLWKDEGGITGGAASDGALDDGVALRVRIHQRLLDLLMDGLTARTARQVGGE